MTKSKVNQNHPATIAQIDKFRDLARELECDDDEAAFDERLRKIAMASREARLPGHWRVDFAIPHGQVANFYSEDPNGTHPSSPVFDVPQKVYDWLRKRGCRQSDTEVDIWFDE